jgi:transcriptional regulator with XRE-family HTH domain
MIVYCSNWEYSSLEQRMAAFIGRHVARTQPLKNLEYRLLVARLVGLREAADLSQVEASKRLGRSPSYITKVENLYRRVDILELRDLLALYRADANALLRAPWTAAESRALSDARRTQETLERRAATPVKNAPHRQRSP